MPDSQPVLWKRRWLKVALAVVGSLIVLMGLAVGWFFYQLTPVSPADKSSLAIDIKSGMTQQQIAQSLEAKQLIRSQLAFGIYLRASGLQGSLRAGQHQLSPSLSSQQIADKLASGAERQTISLTIRPGETLGDLRKTLLELGYTGSEIDSSFTASYSHRLLASRPAGASLEGYLYPETHNFDKGTSLSVIYERFFDDYYRIITDNQLVELYSKQGLDLHQAIILASVVQKEVSSKADSAQVAQVFLKRLDEDIPLGADATFVFIARKEGRTPVVNDPSPYNTRVHRGLPPGPIAFPGEAALLSIAHPAAGDYLYFVSGDDGATHFSRTESEHIANTRKYCIVNCALF